MRLKLKDVSQQSSVKIPHQRIVKLKGSGAMRSMKKEDKQSASIGKEVSDNIKFDPRKFYRTFRPFTDFKNKQGSRGNICLKVNDVLEGDQTLVANHFVKNFSTMADGIGVDYVNDCVESDFRNHNSLLNISTNLSKGDQHGNRF